ncbi:MAG TPA: hypothetical protein DDW52_23100 [Planctomycetaceae bacterium]|nr:hypothetical protein [Planctomycetaceae bacterium]
MNLFVPTSVDAIAVSGRFRHFISAYHAAETYDLLTAADVFATLALTCVEVLLRRIAEFLSLVREYATFRLFCPRCVYAHVERPHLAPFERSWHR